MCSRYNNTSNNIQYIYMLTLTYIHTYMHTDIYVLDINIYIYMLCTESERERERARKTKREVFVCISAYPGNLTGEAPSRALPSRVMNRSCKAGCRGIPQAQLRGGPSQLFYRMQLCAIGLLRCRVALACLPYLFLKTRIIRKRMEPPS